MQPYGYALGNPLRLADPTGLFSQEGPGASNPGTGITFRPGGSGIVIAQPKPVNKPGFVPPAPMVGF